MGCRWPGRDDEGQVELELPCGPVLWRLLCAAEHGTELAVGEACGGIQRVDVTRCPRVCVIALVVLPDPGPQAA